MKWASLLCTALLAGALAHPVFAGSDVSLDPKTLGKPAVTSWPTFNGDYTGQRYSTLNQITVGNVGKLAERWVYKVSSVGSQRGAPQPVIKCTPL